MERRSPDRPHIARPLKRGKACLTCRFLKIKCDGERPICGPCLRHPKDDPCEYADGPGRSRTRALEETISRLEARIRELEHPDMSTPAVTLHDPYTSYTQSLHLNTPPVSTPAEGLAYSPSSPFSVTSTLSTRSSPPSGSTSSSSISPLADVKLLQPEALEEPSAATMRNLMDRFFTHAEEFGFFLDISRVYSGAFIPHPYIGNTNVSRPSQGLMRVIYLWGAHLTPSLYPPTREHEYMLRALADTGTNLSSSEHPQKVLQTIQAEVLLAYYFFRIGRCLEARLHATSAASLALGGGLHKLRSGSDSLSDKTPIAFLSSGPIYLPEPRDAVEEGERINGFWAVLMLCKNLNVAFAETTGSVCGIFESPGLSIDTPWPLSIESYKDGYLPPPNSNTIHNFLSGVKPEFKEYESSMLTITVKASILFHRATYLSDQFSPQLQTSQMHTFSAAWSYLDHIIENLRAQLPPVEDRDIEPASPTFSTWMKMAYLAHALTNAASIKLHAIFAYSYPGYSEDAAASREKCLSAAQEILRVGEISINASGKDFACVNPIMGTLWVAACQVFISEFNRLRTFYGRSQDTWANSPTSPSSPTATGRVEDELLPSIQRCLSVLNYIAAESLLIRYQLAKIQEFYVASTGLS